MWAEMRTGFLLDFLKPPSPGVCCPVDLVWWPLKLAGHQEVLRIAGCLHVGLDSAVSSPPLPPAVEFWGVVRARKGHDDGSGGALARGAHFRVLGRWIWFSVVLSERGRTPKAASCGAGGSRSLRASHTLPCAQPCPELRPPARRGAELGLDEESLGALAQAAHGDSVCSSGVQCPLRRQHTGSQAALPFQGTCVGRHFAGGGGAGEWTRGRSV